MDSGAYSNCKARVSTVIFPAQCLETCRPDTPWHAQVGVLLQYISLTCLLSSLQAGAAATTTALGSPASPCSWPRPYTCSITCTIPLTLNLVTSRLRSAPLRVASLFKLWYPAREECRSSSKTFCITCLRLLVLREARVT